MPVLIQYSRKGFGEENVSGSREQKKLQRTTGNSGWLVCASFLLHSLAADRCDRNCTSNACNEMQGSPHNTVHSASIIIMHGYSTCQ